MNTMKVGDEVQVKFPKLNKNDTLEENDKYISQGYHLTRCKIQKLLRVPSSIYDALGECLLDDNDIWEEIGGTFDGITTNVVCVSDGTRTFFVNTECYTYARYVGRLA